MATVGRMDFFESQEHARRRTSVLIVYYVLAVALIILAVYLAVTATFVGFKSKEDGQTDLSSLWQPGVFFWVSMGTVLVVLLGSMYKIAQLSSGGEAVALLLGGTPVNANTTDPAERRILNVVEEMAIASGIPIPRVFLLDEVGINAFAAGFTPKDAVIGVTRGCVGRLTRDELQGVVAHEFSHILNGDMRLNLRLVGVLHGILLIAMIGYGIVRVTGGSSGGSRSSKKGNALPILLFGLGDNRDVRGRLACRQHAR